MDVITVLQPENQIQRSHNPFSRFKTGSGGHSSASAVIEETLPRQTRSISLPFSPGALREIPAALSFPVLFLFVVTVFIIAAPLTEGRFGFYLLDTVNFPSEMSAEAAMVSRIAPGAGQDMAGGAAIMNLPASIQSVTYTAYKVKQGDTVSAIILRYGLKNLSTVLSVNNIDNARRIRSGQTLRIPSMDGLLYTVQRGDSLAAIAGRYSIPVTTILDVNDLANDTLSIGQELFIPGAALSSYDLKKAMGELFIFPINGRLTSAFGYRSDPFTGARTFHSGIDLAAPTGTSIKATLDGKVATTGYNNVFGNYVIITHDGGYQSLYAHLSQIGVKRGQSVIQGGVIGKVGNTGYSTGPHVHFSIYKNGKVIDPYSVLK
ncbi:M23 family metallopeptidase [Brucepastera parasyntrophica]|uniref:M23 family metallopeptidase n=1 Tax=Brucepastera parasyntrophica TaxID=2880008 RepID=UPI002108905A|nr:M23 family metallopeptidase [Brucepastera parasyntrophica]ULQ59415.1 M23 family metallopeptidase [Brucepastera parasyntrophica]